MKDAYEVLYQKEADLARVRQEVESLTMAASLLADEQLSFFVPETTPEPQSKKGAESAGSLEVEATGTIGAFSVGRRPGFWESLRRRRS